MGKGGARKGSGRSFASVREKLHKFSKGESKGGKGFRKGKGKGKGKPFRAAALKSQFWERKKDSENRTELEGTYTGAITKYVYKNGWGFIAPDDVDSLPEDAKQALEKQKADAKERAEEKGKEASDDTVVYFRKPDVDPEMFPIDEDTPVTFELYMDDKGLGAHSISEVAGADGEKREKKPKGKSKGKAKDRDGKSSGKGKDRDHGRKGASKGKGNVNCHVIELEETDESFPFRQKLLGERGTNVHHIQDTCGAHIQVSKYQPLRIEISSETSRNLNHAVKMTEDLVSAVWDEYQKSRKPKGGSKGKDRGKDSRRDDGKGKGRDGGKHNAGGKDSRRDDGKGKGRDGGKHNAAGRDTGGQDRDAGGKGKGRSEFNKSLKLRPTDPAFRLRGVIVGEGGANVKHIQQECQAKVNVRDDNGELRVEIGADSQDALRRADAMVKDLIGVAYGKYEDWKKEQGGRDRDSGGKGKSKDKGKRRERDDRDDRPVKRHRN